MVACFDCEPMSIRVDGMAAVAAERAGLGWCPGEGRLAGCLLGGSECAAEVKSLCGQVNRFECVLYTSAKLSCVVYV